LTASEATRLLILARDFWVSDPRRPKRDIYAFAAQLQKLHPDNRHVPDKIRQQLQVLRDLGFVEFLGGGRYHCL